MKSLFIAAIALANSTIAAAHAGHSVSGAHGHATDAWGFVVLGAVAAAALWFRRGK